MEVNDEKSRRKLSVSASGIVAIILAVGLVLALLIIVTALMWAAYIRLGIDPANGLSENATQLLSGTFSGIISLLSAYIGFTVGKKYTNGNGNGNGFLPPPKPVPPPSSTSKE